MAKLQELLDEIRGLVETGAADTMDAASLRKFLRLWINDLGEALTSPESMILVHCDPPKSGSKKPRLSPEIPCIAERSEASGEPSEASEYPILLFPKVARAPRKRTPGQEFHALVDREFHYWRSTYPARPGSQDWVGAKKTFHRLRGRGRGCNIPYETILAGTERYQRYLAQRGKLNSEFVLGANNFLSRRAFEEEWHAPTPQPKRRPDPTHYPDPPLPPSPKELMDRARLNRQASEARTNSSKNGKG